MSEKQYRIEYIIKNREESEQLYVRKDFNTYEEAQVFKNTTDNIYWYIITKINASSAFPKLIITEIPGSDKYVKKTGILQTHFETGMECLGLTFVEDGIHGPPNPNFDPTKPESRSNFRNFASYEALHFLTTGMLLELNDQLIGLIKDREFAKEDGYRLSFYPRGFSRNEIIDLFQPETVRVNLYIPIKDLVK